MKSHQTLLKESVEVVAALSAKLEAVTRELVTARETITRLEGALRGIIEIGKRDMSNPKYDGYFEFAQQALQATKETP